MATFSVLHLYLRIIIYKHTSYKGVLDKIFPSEFARSCFYSDLVQNFIIQSKSKRCATAHLFLRSDPAP
ncbi:unnamed protein product [Tenebrio molitor]|nr:unnamed protein product [Tenebrio molitor]